jgi:hypothetical protein
MAGCYLQGSTVYELAHPVPVLRIGSSLRVVKTHLETYLTTRFIPRFVELSTDQCWGHRSSLSR